ncbi:MAG TPA: glycosyltransferase [Verrucomicrobiae bacterium]|nr:glycosyltransferase [Verrucomicrobiae bacterium]
MNANAPAVSVIVAAFNAEKFIAETLASVCAQTFGDFEVIVVDDGSTDNTAAIAREFCQKDSRFQLVQRPNGGISSARNLGIQKARSEWVAFLDSDDIWLPEKLARQMALAAADPKADLIFTNYHAWDGEHDLFLKYPESEALPEGDLLRHLVSQFLLLPSTIMVRRQTVINAGMFDEKRRHAEDWDLWLRMALKGLWARGAREPLARYRFWPGAATSKKRLDCLKANITVLEQHFASVTEKRPELLDEYRRSLINVRNHLELFASRQFVNDPKALSKVILNACLRERNFRFLKWYVFLKWPAWLGGRPLQRRVQKKIAAIKFRGDQKDNWSLMAAQISSISVIVPVFNGAPFIAETLESVRTQTFREIEVIVVDDGSTDNTAEIVQKFCAEDSRFTLIQQKNAGVSAARNTAIHRARYEWIAFLDGDDVWLPEKLARQADALRSNPAANFCYTNFSIWDGRHDLGLGFSDDRPMPAGDVLEQLIFGIRFVPSTALVRRDLVIEAGLFRKEMESSEDWDLWLRMASRELRVCGVREPLVRYRQWPGSVTAKNRLASVTANLRVAENTLPLIAERFPRLSHQCRRSIAATRTVFEIMSARNAADGSEIQLSKAIWNAWKRERRLKWLRWYAFLRWPVALGGGALRNGVQKKIRERWPMAAG